MEYRRFDDTLIIRIDKNEEITEQIRLVAERENIRLASVQALGAVDDFTVGVRKFGGGKGGDERFKTTEYTEDTEKWR